MLEVIAIFTVNPSSSHNAHSIDTLALSNQTVLGYSTARYDYSSETNFNRMATSSMYHYLVRYYGLYPRSPGCESTHYYASITYYNIYGGFSGYFAYPLTLAPSESGNHIAVYMYVSTSTTPDP